MEKPEMNGKALVEAMDDFQTSRWLALCEAVEVISEYTKKKKLKFNEVNFKSNAIEDYVNHNSNIILRKLVGQEKRVHQ